MTKEIDPLELAFARLLKEGKKKVKTMGEARKSREKKTINNIMKLKTQYNRDFDKLLEGTFVRTEIIAIVQTEVCCKCQASQDRVENMQVWSQSTKSAERQECTNHIRSNGAYEFNQDLPIHIRMTKVFVPRCAKCLVADANARIAKSHAKD